MMVLHSFYVWFDVSVPFRVGLYVGVMLFFGFVLCGLYVGLIWVLCGFGFYFGIVWGFIVVLCWLYADFSFGFMIVLIWMYAGLTFVCLCCF